MVLNNNEKTLIQETIQKDYRILTQLINVQRMTDTELWKHQFRTKGLTLDQALELQRMMHNLLTLNDVYNLLTYYELMIDNLNQTLKSHTSDINKLIGDKNLDDIIIGDIKPSNRDDYQNSLTGIKQVHDLSNYLNNKILIFNSILNQKK